MRSNPDLQLRPMHVTREERVRAHVSICMLANFLMNDMEQQLQAAHLTDSPQTVLEGLRSCQVHRLEVQTLKRSILKVQEVSETQQATVKALRCDEIVQEPFKKQILEQCEKSL